MQCWATNACFGAGDLSLNRTWNYEISAIHPRVKHIVGERLARALVGMQKGAPQPTPKLAGCRLAGQQLVLCMERAPCVTQGRHASISECLKAGDTEGCEALRRGYFECRRGQLDMRSRIRGRKHLDTGEQPPS